MRLLSICLCLLLPITAHATCEGRDLRLDLSAETQAELDRTISDIPFPEGNHWIATKDGTVLHLIGTLHTNDARMGPVVDRLTPVLSQADAFYFEVTKNEMDAFEKDLSKDFSPVLITSGPTLVDLMSEDDWAALSATLAERGIPSWMAAKMRPWFLSMMLGIPPCLMDTPEFDRGMDTRLTELAEKHDIPQHSLERIDDLIALFDSHPLEEQVASLARLAGALQAGNDQMITMANAYIEEQHAAIMELAKMQGLEVSGLTPEEFDAEWHNFEDQLLVQRNANWMEKILELKDQTAVIAVGAGHLSNDYGLLNQLQQAGYTLERAEF
ncbi:polysaccharide biosynthesis protein GumN [Ruegeria sp. ANG-R]|uniref:TraB/GumN family protein n=1 Tax=Ruegeria sp. ANG-R TaxID=1577903 RepID=UPI00057E5A16|nr:TraB/GumN family protein [Ruegeria sp. ANG-R]KIC41640.1 polysaccharide biosynthesis protein GumN [Ruegeria sp. ANG-R]